MKSLCKTEFGSKVMGTVTPLQGVTTDIGVPNDHSSFFRSLDYSLKPQMPLCQVYLTRTSTCPNTMLIPVIPQPSECPCKVSDRKPTGSLLVYNSPPKQLG